MFVKLEKSRFLLIFWDETPSKKTRRESQLP